MSFVPPKHWRLAASPNYNSRPDGVRVTAIVLHADASGRIESSLDWCRRPDSKVSYHIMVGRSGTVFSLVHPLYRAWHCGVSELDGVPDVNDYSVGVCLSNRNDGEPYPPAQVMEAADVCVALCKHYGITTDRIVTHAAVARPVGRKTDPKGLDMSSFRGTVNALLGRRP